MKETIIELSENGWEYTGHINIISKNNPKKLNDTTLKVDDVIIEFDEDIRIVSTANKTI